MRTWILAVGLAVGAVGCGDDEPAGGGGSGGSGGGGSGAGGSEECSEFIPPEVGAPVQQIPVVIQNATATTIYLGATDFGCSSPPPYQTTTVGGDAVKSYLGACEFTCADVANGGCNCAADCALPTVILLAPGGSYTTSWSPGIFESVEMPEECYSDPTCIAPTCLLPRPASDPLLFGSSGYPTVTCSAMDCDCTPDASGSCQIQDATTSGTEVLASTQWNPGDETITIVFE
jgi:hypothetical protein